MTVMGKNSITWWRSGSKLRIPWISSLLIIAMAARALRVAGEKRKKTVIGAP
jgi:hypothetical protein